MTTSVTESWPEDGGEDLFTPEFKRLKARSPLPDLSRVVNLDGINWAAKSKLEAVDDQSVEVYQVRSCGLVPLFGLRPCEEWKAVQFPDYPGFIVIQNPFLDGYQRYWVHRCLQDFSGDVENVTNLTALGAEQGRDLWGQFLKKKSSTFTKQDPLRKLRWTTLGYHYNWTTKEYCEEHKAEFPADVNCLSQYLAACLGFGPYQSQAAIVNYYHLDSTLAGHVDHSEVDHSAPLFSISFGQACVFMLGGLTKSVKPLSIFLRSGDICVMSGACRLAYHAVPKILAPSEDEPVPSCFKLRLTPQHETHDNMRSKVSMHDSFTSERNDHCKLKCTSVSENKEIYREQASTKAETPVHCVKSVLENGLEDIKNSATNNAMEYDEVWKQYNLEVEKVNCKIQEVIPTLDFSPFEIYLNSSRINLNIRQVLTPGWTRLPGKCSIGERSLNKKMILEDADDVYSHSSENRSLEAASFVVNNSSSSYEEAELVLSENEIVKKNEN